MTNHRYSDSRRSFLRATAAAAVPSIVAASSIGNPCRAAASDRITLGVIGLGSRGYNLIDGLLRQPDTQIVAICDVDSKHYRDRSWGQGTAFGREPAAQRIANHPNGQRPTLVTKNYREICRHDDIDAVVVATPDHWHALCCLEAMKHGKDVYCEKPITHTFHEGQLVYRESQERQRVFQTGSQQRSSAEFRRAVELVRNGHLGDLKSIQIGLPPGYNEPQGDATVTEPPGHLDYDLWCGPAEKLPYMRARHHRWWRGHTAYGGGVLMDWIGHHNDIAHWAMDVDQSGPKRIEAVDWQMAATDVYDTPHQYEIRCEYDRGVQTSISSRHPTGVRFVGDQGWVFVSRGKLQASDPTWTRNEFDPGPQRVERSDDHVRNFLDSIKSRKPCIAPAQTAHRSITPGHLGYVSHQLGRPLRWDAIHETVIEDTEANRLLQSGHNES